MEDNLYFGRMTDPTSASRIKGPCGDDMEFYLIIKNSIIDNIKYFTESGCNDTKVAAIAVAKRVIGKNIIDALAINPSTIIKEEVALSEDGKHCAILATTTFYRAIALHMLEMQ